MNSSDQLLRSLFNILLALFVVQIALLFLLEQNQRQHVNRMNNRQPANAQISCGMYRNVVLDEKFQFPEMKSQPEECHTSSCQISGYKRVDIEPHSGVEVHIVSVESGQKIKTAAGRRTQRTLPVVVNIRKSENPIHLVLINKDRIRWQIKLEEGAELSQVTLASKSIAWLEGQGEETPIDFLPSKLMCSYPYSFEDIDNPDNHFRRMISSLRMQLGQKEMSFQGTKRGTDFNVPFYDSAEQENIRIAKYRMKKEARKRLRRLPAAIDTLQFELKGYQLTTVGQMKLKSDGSPANQEMLPLPAKVRSLYRHNDGRVFVIYKHQFGIWDPQGKSFTALMPPATLPQLSWPLSMAFDQKRQELWIPSKDGDGYIFAFKPKDQTWRVVSPKNGARMVALSYSPERDAFYALEEAKEIQSLLEINHEGRVRRSIQLSQKIPFLKNEWIPELKWKKSRLLLRISKPSSPEGEFFVIDAKKGISRQVFL